MAKLMATATCTAFSGALEGTGERVGRRVLLVPAPHRPEDLLPANRRRLSHRTCRRRTRAAERTGFHHLHTTEVHPLTPRFGPPDGNRTRPRRARKAWKPQAHTEF
jgi:hypothetical protein